jgi:hypothetical protein
MKRVIELTSVAIALALGQIGFAQATNGAIAGSVIDASRAAIAGARVTATSVETGDVRMATTNQVGAFRIESVSPGTYRVEVTAESFAQTTVNDAVVNASVATSVDVTMKAGVATAVIKVSADEVAALKTDSSELSDTLSAVEINSLPISSLNPYSLAVTLPGVTTVTADNYTSGTAFSVNGNRPRDNNFLIEGVDNNDQGVHGQAFQPENIEAVDQVTFLLNSFSAEFGHGGAVSNLVLKSGSNQYHGAAFERLGNSTMNGTDKGDVLHGNQKVKSRENWFGFRVGGPIIPNRLFFFVSNQWDRKRATANLGVLILPTDTGFTTLQNYAGNAQVANLLTAYGSLRGTNLNYATTLSLGLDPNTHLDRGTVSFAGVQRRLGDDENSRELEATSDWIASEKDRLRFRFIQSPDSEPYDVSSYPNQLPGFDADEHGASYNAGVIHTHIFSARLLNELRPAWSRIGFTFDLRPETWANPLALAPAIGIAGVTGYGIPSGVPQGRFQNTYQLEDALSWNKGLHSFQLGFDIEEQRIRDQIASNPYGSIQYLGTKTGSANTTYSSLGNFIDNDSGASAQAAIQFVNPTARPTIWVQNYYAEDNWKLRHNLSFDFGLRYEYDGAPFNSLPYPAFDSKNPVNFPGGLRELSNKSNFAPRAGFNFSGDAKTVVSGGAGLFYSHVFTNIIDNIQSSSPNSAAKLITAPIGRGTANWAGILGTIINKNALATDTSNVIPQHLLNPLTFQYNLRVQRELPAALVLAVEYVGNRSEHQYATTEFNPTINYGPRLFPTRGRIIREDNTGDSEYNSGQLELQRRTRNGLTLRGVYTYSKLLDDESEIYTDTGANANISTFAELQYPAARGREWGPSAFDHRHRIAFSSVYAPPVWHAEKNLHWAARLVNNWSFSGVTTFQSGQPINVEIAGTIIDWNGDGIYNDRPILVNKNAPITNWAVKGDDPAFGFGMPTGTLCDGPEAWATSDPCKVVSPANTHWVTSTYGSTQNTVGRNSLVAGHASKTDFTVERSFHIVKRQMFLVRAEALNVFNHGSTGSYNSTLISGVPFNGTDLLGNVYRGAVTFGNQPLTVSGNRTLRIYARYQF